MQLTHADAARVVAQFERALAARPQRLTIEGSALQQFDSSALALLLHAIRLARPHQTLLHVQGLPERAWQLAGLYGVADLLRKALDAPAVA
jgi:phospholipid transport system transporter-binding protein